MKSNGSLSWHWLLVPSMLQQPCTWFLLCWVNLVFSPLYSDISLSCGWSSIDIDKIFFFSSHGVSGFFGVLTWSFHALLEHWTTILHHQHWRCDPQCSSYHAIDEAHSFVLHYYSFILLYCFPQPCSPRLVMAIDDTLAFSSNSEILLSSMYI